jgi:AcrR family transcriptional regulator
MRKIPTSREHNRPAILAVAADLLAQKGVAGMTLQAIADAAGLNRTTMYYYFRSKRSVIDALFAEFANSANKSYTTIPAPGQVSARERLFAGLTSLVSWLIEEQRLYRAFDRSAPSLPNSIARQLKAIRRQGRDTIVELLRDGVRTAEFAIDDMTTTAVALIGMCTGVAWWYSPAGPLKPAQVATFIARLGVRAVLADAHDRGHNRDPRQALLEMREILDALLAGAGDPQKPNAETGR